MAAFWAQTWQVGLLEVDVEGKLDTEPGGTWHFAFTVLHVFPYGRGALQRSSEEVRAERSFEDHVSNASLFPSRALKAFLVQPRLPGSMPGL